jgi:PAS domain S-box-containing protein
MKFLNSRTYISLGLASLTASLLLVAAVLDFLPDRDGAVREGRATHAETLAAAAAAMIVNQDIPQLENILSFALRRNGDLLSAAIRTHDGTAVVIVGPHENYWVTMTGARSTEAQIQVPIIAGRDKWGQLELRYRPVGLAGIAGLLQSPLLRLTAFVGFAAFLAFYLYLGRVLNQLDPSRAIPGRVRTALDTLAEGLLVLDRQQNIVLANEALCRLLGRTPESLIGLKVQALPWLTIDPSSSPAEQPWTRTLARGHSVVNETIKLVDADSKTRTFIVNCAPVLGGKRPAGVLVSLDDVTQLEESKVELSKAKQKAEAANQAKSEFLANVSHDIRTPMNAILGFTELLKRGHGRSEADAKKYLDTIHASGKHLLELINDILDLSKIESGQLEPERSTCSPYTIVNEVVTALAVKAREKSITLALETRWPIPASITTDATYLRRIVTNLVGNAVKFTERGGVTVVLRLERAGASRIAIDVVDTGIGIAADKLDKVFDPFVQADSSVTRRFGGTGLGLTISRRLARALGGDIAAKSEHGRGSTFTVTADTGSLDGIRMLAEADVAPMPAAAAASERWHFPGGRILIVDDGPENRELLRLVLSDSGLDIVEAENGLEALQKMREQPCDLVLMDMQMPIMDGYTAARRMREMGVTVPIIAMTANAMKGAEKEVVDAGCSGLLTKPIDIERTLQVLADLLGGRRIAERSGRRAGSVLIRDDHETTSTPESTSPVRSRLAANSRLRPAIRKFTMRLNEQLVAIDRAFRARDFQDLAALAHWLRGAAGTVGYDDFTEPAARLEAAAKDRDEAEAHALIAVIRELAQRIEEPQLDAGEQAAA